MMHANASRGKRMSVKKLFDAEKARRRLAEGSDRYKESRKPSVSIEKHKKAKAAMLTYMKNIGKSKGGKPDERKV